MRDERDGVKRVLIADGVEDWRFLVRRALEADGGWRVVGEASDGDEAVELALTTRPDVVIVDLEMPPRGGAEAVHHLRQARPDLLVVVWTVEPLCPRAGLARDHGAVAVLDKGDGISPLMSALVAAVGTTGPSEPG